MNDKQITYLKKNDIPYSPSLFQYAKGNFKKYCAILKLAAYRKMKWEDSEKIENIYNKLIKGDIK
jgi:hypothetical protein